MRMIASILFYIASIAILSGCQSTDSQFTSLSLDSNFDYFYPVWSPSNDSIIFIRRVSEQVSDLWIINTAGNLTNTTPETGAYNLGPVWSPDGQVIAYLSLLNDQADIWITSEDSSNRRNITNRAAGNTLSPFWSPDGNYIAFSSSTDFSGSDLWVVKSDGTSLHNLTTNLEGFVGIMSWSADSRYIATSISNEIIIIDVQNETHKSLISNALSPSWSPALNEILYIGEWQDGNADIFVIGTDGGLPENLTRSTQINETIGVWSPDGEYIAYTASASTNNRQIGVLERKNPSPTIITNDLDCNPGVQFSWSPDSEQIAFDCTDNQNTDIWIIDRDGSNAINLTGG